MKYTDFKHDGKQVSRLGLGCMRLPSVTDDQGISSIDEPKAIELIRKAIDSGVNYIDTAYMYAGSEAVVGKALKDGYREKVILATKLPMSAVKTKEDLQKYYDAQMAALDVEHIDVYFLHNLFETNWAKVLNFDAIDFMLDLKRRGKISYIAASIHSELAHFKTVVDYFDWDLIMLQYNYYDKYNQAGMEGLKHASAKGIPVAVMEPLHGGLLTNDVPQVVEDAFTGSLKDLPNSERAFKWLYDQPEITIVLSGTSTMEQLEDSLRIFENAQCNVLTAEDQLVYDAAREAWKSIVNIECTACNYCMPCPAGVNIPGVFHYWNEIAKTTQQKWLYNVSLVMNDIDASKCVECGACAPLCPQKIDIPNKLKEAHTALT